MNWFCLLFLSLSCISPVLSQNLIPNPSFEEMNTCCERDGKCAPVAWRGVVNDGMHTTRARKNFPAKSGFVFANIIMADAETKNHRTYIQVPLLCELVAGETYQFEMYARAHRIAVNHIGVYFSDTLICIPPAPFMKLPSVPRELLPLSPQLSFRDDSKLLYNRKGWLKLVASYTASGGEKYLVIGNFIPDTELSWKYIMPRRKISRVQSVYDIDDVSLVPVNTGLDCDFSRRMHQILADRWRHSCNNSFLNCEMPGHEKLNSRKIVLDNIFFEISSWELLPGSDIELDDWVKHIKEGNYSSISISGHTDDQGTPEFNHMLSLKRAEAVAQYFISKGIPERDIMVKGYGNTKPVAGNDSIEGRRKNRRVEIMLE